MLRFSIVATARSGKSFTAAATNFRDLAQYITDHAAEALDPEGTSELTLAIRENEGDTLFRPRKGVQNGNGEP